LKIPGADFSSPNPLFVREGGHCLCSRDFNRRGPYFYPWGISDQIKVFNYPAVETAATQTKPADAG